MESKPKGKVDCPICFEVCEESDARFLPCGGVFCDGCLLEFLRRPNILDCPECGNDHLATNGIQSFPNAGNEFDYSEFAVKKEDESECRIHGSEASIYCDELFCQNTVKHRQQRQSIDGAYLTLKKDPEEATDILKSEEDDIKKETKSEDNQATSEKENIKTETKREDEDSQLGTLVKDEARIKASEVKNEQGSEAEIEDDISEFIAEVLDSQITKFSALHHIYTNTTENAFFLCGRGTKNNWTILKYDPITDHVVTYGKCKNQPSGMTGVVLKGVHCIALSYYDQKIIQFRPMNDLKKILLDHSTDPHRPSSLCAVYPTTLIYEDRFMHLCEIRFLDCSSSPPICNNVLKTQQSQILDMCCVKAGDKQLLVATRGFDGGIYGYDVNASKLVWLLKGKFADLEYDMSASAVTFDERGRIYAYDASNNCVHVVSSRGTYLKVVLNSGQIAKSGPVMLRWCHRLGELLLGTLDKSLYSITRVAIKDGPERKQEELPQPENNATATDSQTSTKPSALDESSADQQGSDKAVEHKCLYTSEVLRNLDTGLSSVEHMCLHGSSSMFLCGRRNKEVVIMRFNTETGAEVNSITLLKMPAGMTRVDLEGVPCLAISHRRPKDQIEFRVSYNLSEVVLTKNVPWAKPGRLFSSSSDQLLFVDESQIPQSVHSVTVDKTPWIMPTCITFTKHKSIFSACATWHQGKDLLVISSGEFCLEVVALNKVGSVPEWNLPLELPNMSSKICPGGLSKDAAGNLFVCDRWNMCVHVVSKSGEYKGAMLKDAVIGKPQHVLFDNKNKLLVGNKVHLIDGERLEARKFHIAVVQLTNTSEAAFSERRPIYQSGPTGSVSTVTRGDPVPHVFNPRFQGQTNQPAFVQSVVNAPRIRAHPPTARVAPISQHIGNTPLRMRFNQSAQGIGDPRHSMSYPVQPIGYPRPGIQQQFQRGGSSSHLNRPVLNPRPPSQNLSPTIPSIIRLSQSMGPPPRDKDYPLLNTREPLYQPSTSMDLSSKTMGYPLPGSSHPLQNISHPSESPGLPPSTDFHQHLEEMIANRQAIPNQTGNQQQQMHTQVDSEPVSISKQLDKIPPWERKKNTLQGASTSAVPASNHAAVVDSDDDIVIVETPQSDQKIGLIDLTEDDSFSVKDEEAAISVQDAADTSHSSARNYTDISSYANKYDGKTGNKCEDEEIDTIRRATDREVSSDFRDLITSRRGKEIRELLEPLDEVLTTEETLNLNLTNTENILVEISTSKDSRRVITTPREQMPTVKSKPAHLITGQNRMIAAQSSGVHPSMPQKNQGEKVKGGREWTIQMECKGQSHTTGFEHISFVCVVDFIRIAVCGKVNEEDWRLTQFNTTHGGKIRTVLLKEQPHGLALIKLGEKLCLAVSYLADSKIVFYNADKLDDVVLTYSMPFHKPCAIHSATQSILLYEDTSVSPRIIHWLDCTTSLPIPLSGMVETKTQQNHIKDMCTLKKGSTWLLIVTQYSTGIYAYDAITSKMTWSVTEPLLGNHSKLFPQAITSDSYGNLFVLDTNNECIQMFSPSGVYLGPALVSVLKQMRCISSQRNLVIIHKKNLYCNFALVKVWKEKANIAKKPTDKIFRPVLKGQKKIPNNLFLGDKHSHNEMPSLMKISCTPVRRASIASAKIKAKALKTKRDLMKRLHEKESTDQRPMKRPRLPSFDVRKKPSRKLVNPRPAQPVNKIFTVDTRIVRRHVTLMCLLSNGYLAVCGQHDMQWTMAQYSLSDGEEVRSLKLFSQPSGMTEILVEGTFCVALAYASTKEIHFHVINDLNRVLYSMPVAPHNLKNLFTLKPSSLMYVRAVTQDQKEIQWLNCSHLPLRKASHFKPVRIKPYCSVLDLCCIEPGLTLVVTHGHKGVSAYSVETNQLQWYMKGKVGGFDRDICAQGIAVHGVIYVCDEHNYCIHMLTIDGRHNGAVCFPVAHGIPWRLRWSRFSSSLVAVSFRDRKYHISQLGFEW